MLKMYKITIVKISFSLPTSLCYGCGYLINGKTYKLAAIHNEQMKIYDYCFCLDCINLID